MTEREYGIESTTLIFRIGSEDVISPNHEMTFRAQGLDLSILEDRIGEGVVLGASDVPGIWTCHGLATLTGYSVEGAQIIIRFEDIRTLPTPGALVTGGDPWADSLMHPYTLDVVPTLELQHLLQGQNAYAQPPVPILTAQEAGGGVFVCGTSYGSLCQVPQAPDFFYTVAQSYGWRCAFTGGCLTSPDGSAREGAVIGVSDPQKPGGGSPDCGLFATSTIAWCYAHGLLAIGEDYDIVRHRMLPAEIRRFLDMVNPKALLFLPEEKSHWPNLALARLHRLTWGL